MIVHLTSAASLLADHELLAPPITSLKAFSAVSYILAKWLLSGPTETFSSSLSAG